LPRGITSPFVPKGGYASFYLKLRFAPEPAYVRFIYFFADKKANAENQDRNEGKG